MNHSIDHLIQIKTNQLIILRGAVNKGLTILSSQKNSYNLVALKFLFLMLYISNFEFIKTFLLVKLFWIQRSTYIYNQRISENYFKVKLVITWLEQLYKYCKEIIMHPMGPSYLQVPEYHWLQTIPIRFENQSIQKTQKNYFVLVENVHSLLPCSCSGTYTCMYVCIDCEGRWAWKWQPHYAN